MKTALAALALLTACSPDPSTAPPETAMERKLLSLVEKFDRWDDNGDGFLDEPELTTYLRGSGHNPASTLAFYDLDSDRKISLKEAQDGYQRSDEAARIDSSRRAR